MGPHPNIKHIVVLMMENRSFDHILGYLMMENPEIDGVTDNLYSNTDSTGEPVRTTSGAAYQGQLILDPGHDVDDVYFQMYGVAFGTPAGDPNMSGFAQSYEQQGGGAQDIMRCFKPEQVPNTAALARAYAVCDRWFSSVPGPTLPNRAFAHFGTSFGRLDMSPVYFSGKPSIYSRLTAAGAQAKIYYYAPWSGTMGLTFLLTNQRQYFGLWGDFLSDCKNNKLPQYSFVEPPYYDNGATIAADQHPDHNIQAGDNFVRQVYEAVRSNDDTWHSTLLLVVWDEHGGIFDHVAPPKVEHPDGFTSTAPVFDFDHYGVRVPAIVISPYIQPGVVDHTLYEHASIPATATAQFIGAPRTNAPYAREQWANQLLALLELDAPRDAPPNWAAQPVDLSPDAVSRATAAAAKLHLDQVNEVHTVLAQSQPELAAQMDPSSVRTEGDASQFVATAMAALHPQAAPLAAGAGASPGGSQ
jgi:phospholipase C